jgi:hypothetical protein
MTKYSIKEAVNEEAISAYKKCVKCDFIYDSKEVTNDIDLCERCLKETAESYSKEATTRGGW